MEAYLDGDAGAFRTLFQRLAPLLLGILRKSGATTSDAEDLIQQTFLQVHRGRLDYQRGARVRPWVITIAMNLRRDQLRRRKVARAGQEELARDALEAPRRDPDAAAAVRKALEALSPDQRAVIELHWFEGLEFTEIAAVVGATPGAVRVRAHRGYARLRAELGDELDGAAEKRRAP